MGGAGVVTERAFTHVSPHPVVGVDCGEVSALGRVAGMVVGMEWHKGLVRPHRPACA